jgi:hypothetical protein
MSCVPASAAQVEAQCQILDCREPVRRKQDMHHHKLVTDLGFHEFTHELIMCKFVKSEICHKIRGFSHLGIRLRKLRPVYTAIGKLRPVHTAIGKCWYGRYIHHDPS